MDNGGPLNHLQPGAMKDHTSLDQVWYVDDATKTGRGPISVTQLGIMRSSAASSVTGSTLVWRHGMGDWSPLSMNLSLCAQAEISAWIAKQPAQSGGGQRAQRAAKPTSPANMAGDTPGES